MDNSTIIFKDDHQISHHHIDEDAMKVLRRLNSKGYTAYLVGGGVRDLLLRKTPKDFDVATNARPREIKKIFRNCWLIGRRFRLAHVKFGPRGEKVIEVSTFRSSPPQSDESKIDLLADDNEFGTAYEDACRRDFTVNSLFYCYREKTVIDYTGGYEDIRKSVIRSIGDPKRRYQEDPVRMLRAIRFACRLDFSLAVDDLEAINHFHLLIGKVSPSRLTDEVYKIFNTNHCYGIFKKLVESHLLEQFAPGLISIIDHKDTENVLKRIEMYQKKNGQLQRYEVWAAMIGVLLNKKNTMEKPYIVDKNIHEMVDSALAELRVSRKDREHIRQILKLIYRLHFTRVNRSKEKILRQPLFKNALTIWELHRSHNPQYKNKIMHWRDMYKSYLHSKGTHVVTRHVKRRKHRHRPL